MRGETFRPPELSEKEKLKKVQDELNRGESVAFREKKEEDFDFANGTDPGLSEEKTGVFTKPALKADQPDISGILEGLDKAAEMSVAEKAEEKEWNQAIKAAKDKIAAEETGLRGKIKNTLKADEEARKAAEEQRWLDKEEAAKRKLSMEAHSQAQSEEAEWNAAIAKAKKRDENQSAIGRLMKRLGFGKNK
ncbi:MAG: hypothetical protein HYT15_03310 [Candidatus Magasanikbacteria bacterium]|nr:hypothetical protein [Candidatus Magasanikbacteria bacterium]